MCHIRVDLWQNAAWIVPNAISGFQKERWETASSGEFKGKVTALVHRPSEGDEYQNPDSPKRINL
jgi:hypothetical protein